MGNEDSKATYEEGNNNNTGRTQDGSDAINENIDPAFISKNNAAQAEVNNNSENNDEKSFEFPLSGVENININTPRISPSFAQEEKDPENPKDQTKEKEEEMSENIGNDGNESEEKEDKPNDTQKQHKIVKEPVNGGRLMMGLMAAMMMKNEKEKTPLEVIDEMNEDVDEGIECQIKRVKTTKEIKQVFKDSCYPISCHKSDKNLNKLGTNSTENYSKNFKGVPENDQYQMNEITQDNQDVKKEIKISSPPKVKKPLIDPEDLKVLLIGEFYKISSMSDIKKLGVTKRCVVLTKSELKVYHSRENVLTLSNPLQRISLFNITKCEMIHLPKDDHLHGKKLHTFCIDYTSLNDMIGDSQKNKKKGKFSNDNNKPKDDFYLKKSGTTVQLIPLKESSKNLTREQIINKKKKQGNLIKLIDEEDDMNNSNVKSIKRVQTLNPVNYNKIEKIIILSSENLELVNKWIYEINSFIIKW